MPAYGYLRKSHVRDASREVSHSIQEGAIRQLAARHRDNGRSLILLSDWDKSGRLGADKRPGYATLLEAIESGRCAALYSYSLSRLGRSLPELARLIADCDRRGIPVRIAVDAVDTSTASGRLLTHVLGAVAQFEADVASERTRASVAVRRANGDRLGAPEYGQGDGEDAAAVLQAFADAGSYSGAARLLNERGVKPRTSRRGWWPSAVAVVVNRLQGRTRRKARGVRAGGTNFILARLLRCPTCGTRLTGARDRGGRRVRYSCRLGSVRPHQRVSVSEHLIMDAIRAEVGHLVTPKSVEVGSADTAKRAALEERKVRILDMFESAHVDREERDRRLATVYEEMSRLDARRSVLAVPRVDWSKPPRELNAFLSSVFEEIALDAESFQPVGFKWLVPEWRR
jgi:DNA invertase Pin-like site-specific DNA recombinase